MLQEILAYRKDITIYDAFIFFNELETLELRLNILDPYVDFFVVVECTETFSGIPKKLYFKDNIDRFEKFRHKILHYIVDDAPIDRAELEQRLQFKQLTNLEQKIIIESLTNSNVPRGQDMWLREFYQRESIKKALVGVRDTDFCFISDVDEIWNPEIIIDYAANCIYKFNQTVYAYYLNNRSSEPWAGTFATSYGRIKNHCLNNMRDAAKTSYTYINNGGWHFTNQGGIERIKSKIESYSHQEFNTATIKSDIEKNIKENKDFVGRSYTFSIDESGLPSYLLANKGKYKEYFRQLP
ncbi:MAG: hypothetical protein ACOYMZ_00535 [Minisyncoccia bacterium]